MEEDLISNETFSDKRKGFFLAMATLIISNAVTVFLAFYYGFDLINVLWIYWFQSIIIGFVNVIEILSLKRFSTEGIAPTLPADKPSSKFQAAFIFIVTYGMFHLAYAIFLNVFFTMFIKGTGLRWNMIIIGSAAFLIHYIIQLFSFSLNKNPKVIPSLAKIIVKPFYRIVPMHLTIIIAVWFFLAELSSPEQKVSIIILLIFIAIKTFVDIIIQFLIYKKQ